MKERFFDVQFFADAGESGEAGGSDGVPAGTDPGTAGGEANKGETKGADGSGEAGKSAPSLLSGAKAPGSESKEGGEGAEKTDPPEEGADGKKKNGEDGKDGKRKEEDGKGGTEDKPLTSDDLVIPEGKTYDEELSKGFLEIINDLAIPRKDLAQKLLDMYTEQQDLMLQGQTAADQAAAKAVDERQKAEEEAWSKASQADTEFGGQKWEASQATIAAGRDHLATPEVVEVIETLGIGNHPEVLRMFYRAGKLVREGRMVSGGGSAGSKMDRAEAIFGESLKGIKKGDSEE